MGATRLSRIVVSDYNLVRLDVSTAGESMGGVEWQAD